MSKVNTEAFTLADSIAQQLCIVRAVNSQANSNIITDQIPLAI